MQIVIVVVWFTSLFLFRMPRSIASAGRRTIFVIGATFLLLWTLIKAFLAAEI